MKFKCAYKKLVKVDELLMLTNPKNNNKHSSEQIDRLAKIIDFQGQRSPIVISNRSGFIIKGHARLSAIQKLKWKEAAVDYQDYNTEAEEYADMTADNEIARWAELDLEKLVIDLKTLDLGDIKLLGLDDFTESNLFKTDNENSQLSDNEENIYSDKISTPKYEPVGEKPNINDLIDLNKYNTLLKEIKTSNLSKEEKEFLTLAASRHIVFNYDKIANFYAHSEKTLQELFENSALVIIDFNKAIENGFVKLTKEINETYLEDTEDINEEEFDL